MAPDLDALRVYLPWPVDVITLAREEFRDQMHNGAGIEELQAGLHGLDFLTRASEIPEPLASMIEANIDEAHMRIALMAEQEAEQRTSEENRQRAVQALSNMSRQAEHILASCRRAGAAHLEARYGPFDFDDEDDDDE